MNWRTQPLTVISLMTTSIQSGKKSLVLLLLLIPSDFFSLLHINKPPAIPQLVPDRANKADAAHDFFLLGPVNASAKHGLHKTRLVSLLLGKKGRGFVVLARDPQELGGQIILGLVQLDPGRLLSRQA